MNTMERRIGYVLLTTALLGACTESGDPPRGEMIDPVTRPDTGAPSPNTQDGALPPSAETDAGRDPDAGREVPPTKTDAGSDASSHEVGDALLSQADGGRENCATPGGAPCDDQNACNGREACDPNHAEADGRGCVKLTPAVTCPTTQACQPSSGTCSSCELQPDADADGERAIACGGTDCDDSNPKVGPSQPELCNGRDDDCNGAIDDGAASRSCKSPTNGVASCNAGNCMATCIDPTQAIMGDACVAPPCAPGTPGCGTITPFTSLDVAVYMARRVKTCFLGAPCDPEVNDCTTGLYDDDGRLIHPYRAGTFQGLPSTDYGIHSTWPAVCLELVMSDEQRLAVAAQLEQFRSNVLAWTAGAVRLNIHTYDLDAIDIGQDSYGDGTWIAPWNVATSVVGKTDFVPDFNMIVTPTRDPAQKLHHNIGACGLTLGADAGIAGAGWSWIPITKGAFWFECENHRVMIHEWLHQVYTAYHQLSGFVDAYGNDFPACGSQADPRSWFPDTHQCNKDPDGPDCGLESCGEGVSEHVLRAHWDPKLRFVGNHCEDGVQDMGETGVDIGGRCADLPKVVSP